MKYIFTSESVSEGHPDKVCDQVSDAVLDEVLANDPTGRVACECFATTGMIVVGGEITTTHYIDLPELVRGVIREIGYDRGEYRFEADSCSVINVINRQSPDIAQGVDERQHGGLLLLLLLLVLQPRHPLLVVPRRALRI